MPILFTALITLMTLVGLSIPITHLFWPQIIEGQVGKQSFVAHMIESWMKGDTIDGFPIRFFADPWHPGTTPWAEEVPLFHWIAAGIGSVTQIDAVTAGRVTSFLFALLLLAAVRGIARQLFTIPPPSLATPVAPEAKTSMLAIWLAPAILIWLPGFQIYSASVIPDLAMLAMIAWGYLLRLKSLTGKPRAIAYLVLGIACLLKYFAFFSLLALFLYDWITLSQSRTKWHDRLAAFVMTTLAGIPTLAYLYYFISHQVPNPITAYIGANGYGHLAGPFLFQAKFYLRFVTWVLIKNPTLALSFAAVIGLVISRQAAKPISSRTDYIEKYAKVHSEPRPIGWLLIDLHFLTYVLFALIFASSFYVHDYYALPFILPILFYACVSIARLLNGRGQQKIAGVILIVLTLGLGHTLSRDATFRLTNYISASEKVREALGDIPDRNPGTMVIYASDFSLPVIPILSKKAGWAFNAEQLPEQLPYLNSHLAKAETRAFVFYAREPGADLLFAQWRNASPRLTAMKIIADMQWPSEGRKGSATRLVVLRP